MLPKGWHKAGMRLAMAAGEGRLRATSGGGMAHGGGRRTGYKVKGATEADERVDRKHIGSAELPGSQPAVGEQARPKEGGARARECRHARRRLITALRASDTPPP